MTASAPVQAQERTTFVIPPGTLVVTEGNDTTFTVHLNYQPSADVTVSVASSDTTLLTVSPDTLTFTQSNHNVDQVITVTAVADDIDYSGASVRQTIELTASGGGYDGATAAKPIFYEDDDSRGVEYSVARNKKYPDVLTSTGALGLFEGFTWHYWVVLKSQPRAPTTLTLTNASPALVTVSPTVLTFTADNWSTRQKVTVSSPDNEVVGTAEQAIRITGAPGGAGSDYASDPNLASNPFRIILFENDYGTLEIPEGRQRFFRFTFPPGYYSDNTLLSRSTNTAVVTLAPQTLVITQAHEGVQTSIAATGVARGSAKVSISAEGMVIASANITVTDPPALAITPSALGVAEGSNATYTVALKTKPVETATITITGHTGTDLALDKTSLTFTTTNWSTPQTVTVTAGQDGDAANDVATLTHTGSNLYDYNGVTGDLVVTTTDDETAGIVLSRGTLTLVEGTDSTYTVKLKTEPTDTVTVAITGHAGTDLTLDPSSASLTFTTTNWSTAQTVTVSAGEDDDAANDAATLLHTASGGDYGSETASLAVTTDDDDTAGIVLSRGTLTLVEGTDSTYTVKLKTQPSDTVTVAITGHSGTDLTLDPASASLEFTTTNWSTAQTVTVSAGEDNDAANDAATLLHTASGGDYGSVTASLAVTTDDDDPAGIVLSTSALGVAEGTDATYTVTLATQPSDTVTVAITGHSGTDLSLDPSSASLEFTTSNWSTPQTVTVSAGQDDDASNDTATLLHTASGGDYNGVTDDVAVTTTDDETTGIVLSTSALGLTEGTDATYTVTLATQPSDTVTVAITGHSGTDLTLDPASASLEFTTTNWSTAQTVTVSAGEDNDAANDAATLLHTASGGDYGSVTASLAVTTDDDDTAGIVLSTSALGVAEGTDATYTVKLATEPSDTVTVAITGHSGTDLSLDPSSASLEFTTSNWSTPQTVTVSAGEDDDASNDTAALLHTASGGGYGSVTASLAVTITDDETAGIVLSTSALGLTEGTDATYTVTLATQPSDTVTVAITGHSGTDLSLDPSSASLEFTTTNWSTPQTVTVSAGEDDDASNDAATLLHTASGGDYGSVTASLAVTITDDDPAGIVLSTSALGVAEGTDATYTVTLATQPSDTVTVAITGHSGTDLSLDPSSASLEFTTSNWSTPQTVTVSAGQDDDASNDTATLLHTASGGDYNGVTDDVAVTTTDDETTGIVLSTSALGLTEGTDATYTVTLATQPSDTVTVAITGHSGTDLSLDPSSASLEFTTSNWSTPQTVTVSAGEDDDASNDTAALLHTASGGGYGSVTASLAVTTTDDETAGIVLSRGALTLVEGTDSTYTVKLATQPSDTVTVAITGHSGTDLTLDPASASLEFTTTNWSTPQTVTVSAGEDNDAANDAATLLHTASGGDYGSVTASLAVTTDDDDTAGIVLSTSALGVAEGTDATYTVKLATEPSDTVTVAITGHSGTDLSLDPSSASLEFTTTNWSTPQTVTVSAGEDDDASNDTAALLHTASGGGYGSVTASLAVTTTDDETAGIVLSTSALGLAEGTDATYTVKLATQPSDTVTVAITGHSGTDLSLDPSSASLEFTTSNWSTPQTVTVSAGEDDDASNDTAALLHTASGGGYGSVTASLAVTTTDDETAGIVLSRGALTLVEGTDSTYTVKLATQPSDTVTVAITGHSGTDLTLDRTSLTFTTTNWSTAQTVTVSAGQDDDATNDAATLLHTASGGGYAGETASLVVTTTDDDDPPPTTPEVGITGGASITEGGNANFTLTADPAPSGNLQLSVTIGQTGDFVASADRGAKTVIIPSSGIATYAVATVDDSADEADGSVNATVNPGDGYSVSGTNGSASVSVADNDDPRPPNRPPTLTASCAPCVVAPGGAVRLTATASDPDGDPLTYGWSAPAGGLAGADEAVARWTAPANPGRFTIRVEVSDGRGESASVEVEVEVVNRAPVFGQVSYRFELPENRGGRERPVDLGTVVAEDPDGDELTYEITSGDRERFTVGARDGVVRYVGPGEDFETEPNQYELIVRVRDGFGADDTVRVVVDVVDVNELPEVTASCDPCTVTRGGEARLEATATDPDGDPITYAWSAPAGALAGADEAVARWTAPANPGRFTIRVEVSDGRGESASVEVEVEVVNRAPAFGRAYRFELPENRDGRERPVDLGAVAAGDPDGDELTYEITSGDRERFTVGARDGVVRYVGPGEDFETEPNQYELIVRVRDGFGADDTVRVVVDVADVNELPEVTASCDPCTVTRGGEARLEATATDPDGDPITYAWSAPAGALAGADEAIARWTAPAELGRFTIRVEVSDGRDGSASAAVEVEVVNRAPAFGRAYRFELPENRDGRERPVDLGAVAAGDPDGDELTYGIVAGDRERFTVGARDGVVRYAGPGEDFETGPNRFELTVRVRDAFGGEARTEVAIEVTDVNELPEVTASCDPCAVTRGGEARLEATASDPDGDPLTYAWSAPAGAFAGADQAVARWTAPEEPVRVALRVQVSDGRGGSASAEVEVNIGNRPPVFEQPAYGFPLPENVDGSERPFDLGRVAAGDPDGDELTYGIASGDRERFAVGARDGVVRYAGPGEDFETEPNRFELTVSALDEYGREARTEVAIEVADVNERPEAADDAVRTVEDEAVTVNVLANDTDPDGDRLRVETVSAASHGTARIVSDGVVTYMPDTDYHGFDSFTYVASDGEGLTAEATVEVTVLPVNDGPLAIGVIPDQALDEGGAAAEVDLSPYFGDVEGDALTYGARSSDPGVVRAAVAGTVLALTPVVYGSTTVTVTAWDPAGLHATQSVRVGVSDRPQRAILGNMLAATARSHLASVRATLGRRIAAGACEASRLTVMGRSVPLGRAEAATMLRQFGTDARSAAASALGVGDGPGAPMPLAPETPREDADRLVAPLGSVPARALGLGGGAGAADFQLSLGGGAGAADFQLSLGGGAGAADFQLSLGGEDRNGGRCPGRGRWSLWGQGDVQTFEGTPPSVHGQESGYDGELSTAYVGLDARLGEDWLAGVALSRSKGAGDWRAGTSDGRLAQTMATIHPYLRWSSGTTSIRASVGAGRGQAENARATGRVGTSGTNLRLGLVELDRRLGAPGGLDLGLVGDAAWARLWTGDGEETIDRQDVAVNQVRIGADLALPARIGGADLTPFGTVYARSDGGAGQTGAGIEVAGGLRAVLGVVSLDAQARMLAFHSANGYGERGAALTLAVGPRGGEGLSFSLSPQWGDPALGTDALRHGPLGRAHRLAAPGSDRWTFDARANYGVGLPGGLRLDLHGGVGAADAGPRFGLRVGLPGSSRGNAGKLGSRPPPFNGRERSWTPVASGPTGLVPRYRPT